MPEMQSPDGSETITPPTHDGARVLRALGWTGTAPEPTPSTSDIDNRPRRGPGRPRKNEG